MLYSLYNKLGSDILKNEKQKFEVQNFENHTNIFNRDILFYLFSITIW